MSDVINGKPSTNFWIIGGAALIWNLIGLVIYIGQVSMSAESLFVLRDAFGVLGVNSLLIPSMVFVIAIALFLYSRTAKSAGWLN